jgi:hypothetical protein
MNIWRVEYKMVIKTEFSIKPEQEFNFRESGIEFKVVNKSERKRKIEVIIT